MRNLLAELAELANERVRNRYYDSAPEVSRRHRSLAEAIDQCENTPVIAEIKFASPSSGRIRDSEPALRIATNMLGGGACGLSILTDPISFQGGLHILSELANETQVPLIMKDIIVSPRQLYAAAKSGADVVVLISELFSEGLCEVDLATMVDEARRLKLETLVEANSIVEFKKMRHYKPDMYGINNRNLSTFSIDLDTTRRILSENDIVKSPIVSESGIEKASDITLLKSAGADAFLVGTSIMKSHNIKEKVRELVNA